MERTVGDSLLKELRETRKALRLAQVAMKQARLAGDLETHRQIRIYRRRWSRKAKRLFEKIAKL